MAKAASRMRWFEQRALTPAEIEIGRGVFGEEIAWSGVRVAQAPPLGFAAMVPRGRTVVFSRWKAWRDFSHAPLGEQGWFVHELAHVWQAERGVVLAFAKLKALGGKAYAYKTEPAAAFQSYNIERQAEIARHLFLARAGAPAKGAPPVDWLEQIWKRR